MSSGDKYPDTSPRPAPKPIKPLGAKGAGGGQPLPPDSPCNVVELTVVNSPNRTVVTTIRVNDVLEVRYVPGPPKQLIVVTGGNAILGSLTPPSMAQLIACITAQGVNYEAVVLGIQGGRVDVQVQPV